jgi:alpha-tubulin suppressor-like RCC1 family protein
MMIRFPSFTARHTSDSQGLMNKNAADVLSEKKGMASALGITLVGLALLTAASVVVGNFAVLSKQVSQVQTLSQEIVNRSELYASALNADVVTPRAPDMTRQCSSIPPMCTQVLSATVSADGVETVLRIQADMVSLIGQSITQDVTLVSQAVTHVTAVDEFGNKTWAISDEGLQYHVWARAAGDPTLISDADLAGPQAENTWVSIAADAGIDSRGALWTWSDTVEATRFLEASNFRSVITGDGRGYAIDSSGNPWVWGKNDKGQLGLGHNTAVTTPTQITGKRMMKMSIGRDSVFGVTMTGDLVTVGASQTGFPANSGFNWQTLNPGTKYKTVASSLAGGAALIDTDGHLTMVGATHTFPTMDGSYTSVSLGLTGGYALGGSGTLYSWGEGADGQLGVGAMTSTTTRQTVMPGTLFSLVSGGMTSAFAVDVAGNLYYFGKTHGGSTSDGYLPVVNVPTKLLTASNFRGISANTGNPEVALLDDKNNLYAMGTAGAGLWPITYMGATNTPVRMPVPDVFYSNTWE